MRAMTTLPIAAVDLLRVLEPARVKRMEEVKEHRDLQQKKARETAEQRAVALEGSDDAQQYHRVEEILTQENIRAEQAAAQELEMVSAGGSEPFRQVFTKARSLLGVKWPLTGPAAHPSSPDLAGGNAS